MFSLENKVVIVTGAAGDLGFASSSAIAAQGGKLVLVDFNDDALEQAAAKLRDTTEVEVVVADVTDEDAVKGYVARTLERFGRIDGFHNNAGIEGASGTVWEYDADEFLRVQQVNVFGAFLGLKHVSNVMKNQKSGAVVNSSSIGGLRGAQNGVAYTVSKHAILGLAREAAGDLAPYGVRVNAIHPGFMETRMLRTLAEQQSGGAADEAMAGLSKAAPLGRLGQPHEVGAAVAYLLSDEASYLTGVSLPIDGGLANLISNAS